MDIEVGAFVFIDPVPPSQEVRRGILRFSGATEFAEGPWMGVELVGSVGKNSGSVFDVEYFACLPQQGVFVRPELVRPYAPHGGTTSAPPLEEEKNAFDMDLRVELEELRDHVASLTTRLEAKALEVEELLLDKEIAEEQRIAAETELEELRLNGGGSSGGSTSHASTNLAEVVVALKHDNAKLMIAVSTLEAQVKELEEEVSAANAAESIVESLTTRNMELDEALADTKTILERILKERDGMQEILSLQDEELRHQRADCEATQAELESLKARTEMQIQEMQQRLSDEQRIVAEMDLQNYEREQKNIVGAEASKWKASMEEVSLALSAVAVRCKPLRRLTAPHHTRATFESLARAFPEQRGSPALLCFAQYELVQLITSASNSLEAECEYMTHLIEGLSADKYQHLRNVDQSNGAADDEINYPTLVKCCALIADMLAAIEWVRLDLLEVTCRLSQASHQGDLILPLGIEDVTNLVSACSAIMSRSSDVHRHVTAFEPPGLDTKALRDAVRSIAQNVTTVRTAFSTLPVEGDALVVPLQSSILRLSRVAHGAAPASPDDDAPATRVVHALSSLASDAQSHARQAASASVDIAPPIEYHANSVEGVVVLWAAAVAAFVSSLSRMPSDGANVRRAASLWSASAGSSDDGDIVLSTQWLLFQSSKPSLLGSEELVARLQRATVPILGLNLLPPHLQEQLKAGDDEEAGWAHISVVINECINAANHKKDTGAELDVSVNIAHQLLGGCAKSTDGDVGTPDGAASAHDAAPQHLPPVHSPAIKEDYARLVRDKAAAEERAEEAKRQLWDAESENQALSLIKADFKRIQGQLEAQEATHRASLKNVSQEYDSAISVLLQKNSKLSTELRDAQRQKLQQVVSPMSLWERTQYQDSLFNTQHQLALASGLALRRYSFMCDWNPTTRVAASPNKPTVAPQGSERRIVLPKVFKFTSKANNLAAREAVLIPRLQS